MVKVRPIAKNNDGSIDFEHSMFALQARGKAGWAGGFGFIRFGHSKFGTDKHVGGYYQKRITGYNNRGRNPARPRRAYYVKMRPYISTNPRTPAQQAHRAKFAAAMNAWSELDPVEKSRYDEIGKREGRWGRQMFLSWYLKNH